MAKRFLLVLALAVLFLFSTNALAVSPSHPDFCRNIFGDPGEDGRLLGKADLCVQIVDDMMVNPEAMRNTCHPTQYFEGQDFSPYLNGNPLPDQETHDVFCGLLMGFLAAQPVPAEIEYDGRAVDFVERLDGMTTIPAGCPGLFNISPSEDPYGYQFFTACSEQFTSRSSTVPSPTKPFVPDDPNNVAPAVEREHSRMLVGGQNIFVSPHRNWVMFGSYAAGGLMVAPVRAGVRFVAKLAFVQAAKKAVGQAVRKAVRPVGRFIGRGYRFVVGPKFVSILETRHASFLKKEVQVIFDELKRIGYDATTGKAKRGKGSTKARNTLKELFGKDAYKQETVQWNYFPEGIIHPFRSYTVDIKDLTKSGLVNGTSLTPAGVTFFNEMRWQTVRRGIFREYLTKRYVHWFPIRWTTNAIGTPIAIVKGTGGYIATKLPSGRLPVPKIGKLPLLRTIKKNHVANFKLPFTPSIGKGIDAMRRGWDTLKNLAKLRVKGTTVPPKYSAGYPFYYRLPAIETQYATTSAFDWVAPVPFVKKRVGDVEGEYVEGLDPNSPAFFFAVDDEKPKSSYEMATFVQAEIVTAESAGLDAFCKNPDNMPGGKTPKRECMAPVSYSDDGFTFNLDIFSKASGSIRGHFGKVWILGRENPYEWLGGALAPQEIYVNIEPDEETFVDVAYLRNIQYRIRIKESEGHYETLDIPELEQYNIPGVGWTVRQIVYGFGEVTEKIRPYKSYEFRITGGLDLENPVVGRDCEDVVKVRISPLYNARVRGENCKISLSARQLFIDNSEAFLFGNIARGLDFISFGTLGIGEPLYQEPPDLEIQDILIEESVVKKGQEAFSKPYSIIDFITQMDLFSTLNNPFRDVVLAMEPSTVEEEGAFLQEEDSTIAIVTEEELSLITEDGVFNLPHEDFGIPCVPLKLDSTTCVTYDAFPFANVGITEKEGSLIISELPIVTGDTAEASLADEDVFEEVEGEALDFETYMRYIVTYVDADLENWDELWRAVRGVDGFKENPIEPGRDLLYFKVPDDIFLPRSALKSGEDLKALVEGDFTLEDGTPVILEHLTPDSKQLLYQTDLSQIIGTQVENAEGIYRWFDASEMFTDFFIDPSTSYAIHVVAVDNCRLLAFEARDTQFQLILGMVHLEPDIAELVCTMETYEDLYGITKAHERLALKSPNVAQNLQPQPPDFCAADETGKLAFDSYGLGWVDLTSDYPVVSATRCLDSAPDLRDGKFCDAEQFTIQLSKQMNNYRTYLQLLAAGGRSEQLQAVWDYVDPEETVKTSDDLYRIDKQQVFLEEGTPFFVGGNGLLSRPLKPECHGDLDWGTVFIQADEGKSYEEFAAGFASTLQECYSEDAEMADVYAYFQQAGDAPVDTPILTLVDRWFELEGEQTPEPELGPEPVFTDGLTPQERALYREQQFLETWDMIMANTMQHAMERGAVSGEALAAFPEASFSSKGAYMPLEDFYNLYLSDQEWQGGYKLSGVLFFVGVRNNADLPDTAKDYVRLYALPWHFDNLGELVLSQGSQHPKLIRDNYSDAFTQAFMDAFEHEYITLRGNDPLQPVELPDGSTIADERDVAAWRFEAVPSESGALISDTSGIYETRFAAEVDWSTGRPRLGNVAFLLTPILSLEEMEAQGVCARCTKNWFLNQPRDFSLTSGVRDFGSQVTLETSNKSEAALLPLARSVDDTLYTLGQDIATGRYPLVMGERGYTLGETSPGRVLSLREGQGIDAATLTYTPSRPVFLRLRLEEPTYSTSKYSPVLYRFEVPGQDAIEPGDQPVGWVRRKLESHFVGALTDQPALYSTQIFNVEAGTIEAGTCNNQFDPLFGSELDMTPAGALIPGTDFIPGKTDFVSIVYVPEDTTVQLMCSAFPSRLDARLLLSPADFLAACSTEDYLTGDCEEQGVGSTYIIGQYGEGSDLDTYTPSVSQVLYDVRSEHVCVKETDTGLDFYWNPELHFREDATSHASDIAASTTDTFGLFNDLG